MSQTSKTTLTSFRLKKSLHEGFKHTCEVHDQSISKVLETLVMLFLSDYQLQHRVLFEARLK
jgi:hypothetical protein